MAFLTFTFRRADVVTPFHTAVISSLMSISGIPMLIRIAWHFQSGRLWAALGAALIVTLVAWQLGVIYRFYKVAYPKAKGDAVLRKSLNLILKTYLWGNAVILILIMGIFQFYLFHR
jgi:hypothetical protein